MTWRLFRGIANSMFNRKEFVITFQLKNKTFFLVFTRVTVKTPDLVFIIELTQSGRREEIPEMDASFGGFTPTSSRGENKPQQLYFVLCGSLISQRPTRWWNWNVSDPVPNYAALVYATRECFFFRSYYNWLANCVNTVRQVAKVNRALDWIGNAVP